jgi:hypothetical protein
VLVTEFARTDDDPEPLHQILVQKSIKYHHRLGQFRATLPNYSVEQFNFVIGVPGVHK